MNEEKRKAFGSVPIYRCPSRRGSGPIFTSDTDPTASINWFTYHLGPQGDYGIVFANSANWYFYNCRSDFANDLARARGPFRVALIEIAGDFSSWKPRDMMAWWQDGISNQIIVGEKHIRPDDVGKCSSTSSTIDEQNTAGDCSILNAGFWKTVAMGRPVTLNFYGSAGATSTQQNIATTNEGNPDNPVVCPIANRPDMPYPGQNLESSSFGSYHPGISLFLVGQVQAKMAHLCASERGTVYVIMWYNCSSFFYYLFLLLLTKDDRSKKLVVLFCYVVK
jgi:hypothetical protein